MIRHFSSALSLFVCAGLLWSASARADIPAGYKGTPFDPMKVGGVGVIPATVKAGPFPIPGRLDFINYDLGGEKVGFHAGDHITNKEGAGYRTDMPVATFSKTNAKDSWYATSTALDGTAYPSATTSDFYIGAVQVNDWFNFTVNVQSAGTYALSTTWSSGNGPPGGEGGDGTMGLQVFANEVMVADWKDAFPDYQTKANFHFWKAYPSFATVTLAAGVQVIKLQSTSKHLNLDYVEFALMGGAGMGGSAGAAGMGAAGTGAAGTGIAGENAGGGAESGPGGAAAGGAAAASAGASNASGGNASAGVAGSANTAGAAQPSADPSNGSSCAFVAARNAPASVGRSLAFGSLALLIGLTLRLRRRRQ